MMIMSATASKKNELGGSSRATVQIRLSTATGMGLTRVGGGSAFFQAAIAIIRWIRKSMSPAELARGSLISNYYQFTLVLTIACTLLVQQLMVTRGESHFLFSRIQLEFGVAFPAPAHHRRWRWRPTQVKPHHDAYEVVLSLPGEMTVCAV
jgi:hypothetical protein